MLMSSKGASPLYEAEFRADDILLFGSEARACPTMCTPPAISASGSSDAAAGISLLECCRFPAGIALSEALRQTGQLPMEKSP